MDSRASDLRKNAQESGARPSAFQDRAPPSSTSTSRATLIKILICLGGIYASFITWGVLQERITTRPYGPDQKYFRASHLINLTQSVLAAIVGYLFLSYRRRQAQNDAKGSSEEKSVEQSKWAAPLFPHQAIFRDYMVVALCQSFSSPLAYRSMQYLDYLTVLLAKSCKLLPVMAVHILLHGRRFPPYKYAAVLLITAGVVMFGWLSQPSSAVAEKRAELSGILLLAGNMLLDGLYNTTQDQMFIKYTAVLTGPHMMCALNLLTSAITAIMLVFSRGQVNDLVWFAKNAPEVYREVLLYGICGALGQVFIFVTLSEFGSLVLVTATVTRKMFSMLLSVVLFNHKLKGLQWLGIALVFGGIISEIVYKQLHQKK